MAQSESKKLKMITTNMNNNMNNNGNGQLSSYPSQSIPTNRVDFMEKSKQNYNNVNKKYLYQFTPTSHQQYTPTMATKYVPNFTENTSSVYLNENDHKHQQQQIYDNNDHNNHHNNNNNNNYNNGIHSAVSSMTGFIDVGYKPYTQFDTDLHSAQDSMTGFIDIAYNKPSISNETSISNSPLPDLPDTQSPDITINHHYINVCIQ